MERPPLLHSTAQERRLSMAGLMLFGGVGIANIANVPVIEAHPAVASVVLIAGGIVALAGVMLALRGIACPSCGAHWVAWSIRTRSALRWLQVVHDLRQCPACGCQSGNTAEQPNQSLERSRER